MSKKQEGYPDFITNSYLEILTNVSENEKDISYLTSAMQKLDDMSFSSDDFVADLETLNITLNENVKNADFKDLYQKNNNRYPSSKYLVGKHYVGTLESSNDSKPNKNTVCMIIDYDLKNYYEKN